MSLLVKMTLSAALVLSIGVPFGAFAAGEKTKGRYKTALGVNVFLFFGTMIAAAAFMFSGNAFAAEETAAAVSNSAAGMGYLSAALATGLSCLAVVLQYLQQQVQHWALSVKTALFLVNPLSS